MWGSNGQGKVRTSIPDGLINLSGMSQTPFFGILICYKQRTYNAKNVDCIVYPHFNQKELKMAKNWKQIAQDVQRETDFFVHRMFGKLRKTIIDEPRSFTSFDDLDAYIDRGVKNRQADVQTRYF